MATKLTKSWAESHFIQTFASVAEHKPGSTPHCLCGGGIVFNTWPKSKCPVLHCLLSFVPIEAKSGPDDCILLSCQEEAGFWGRIFGWHDRNGQALLIWGCGDQLDRGQLLHPTLGCWPMTRPSRASTVTTVAVTNGFYFSRQHPPWACFNLSWSKFRTNRTFNIPTNTVEGLEKFLVCSWLSPDIPGAIKSWRAC